MKTRVHLMSTFGPNNLLQPSIQLAALQAHLERADIPHVDCVSHAAFAVVPFVAWPREAQDTAYLVAEFGEYPFSILNLTDFEPALLAASGMTERELLRRVNQRRHFRHLRQPLDWEHLERLRMATRAYVRDRVTAFMDDTCFHVVGFTTDFSQVFSSAYMMRLLRQEFPRHRMRVVLGGAAASLPDTAGAMASLGLDAWCVEGEGEPKLELLCRALSALPDDVAPEDVDNTLDRAVPGLRRVGQPAGDGGLHGLTVQVPQLADLPLPTFDDYFSEMGALPARGLLAPLEHVGFSMPMEGSRGCFATCAFCSNPHSWSGYRKMNGAQVLQRCMVLMQKYPFTAVTFMDVVCDTWATQFAQGLLDAGVTLPSVMCFRAHHPETYFTRMALCGVRHVQVGVEALSSPLLASMDKGTRVVQNLLAQKYLAELGITQWNNLITHYADSTLQDIEETRRVLELTPHLGVYGLSPLCLRVGSPLYDRALQEGHTPQPERDEPALRFPALLANFDDAGVQRTPPEAWLPNEVARAWSAFEDWYETFSEETQHATCTVTALPGGRLRVLDHRGADERVLFLTGDDARVLDACHAGPTRPQLQEMLRLPEGVVDRTLERLLGARLVVETEGHCVALPLRHRDVLVQNFYRSQQTAARTLRLLNAPD